MTETDDVQLNGSPQSSDDQGDPEEKKTGRFTSEESALIEKRLKDFMEIEEIAAADLVPALRENEDTSRGSMTVSASKHRKYSIWKELASELPHRTSKAIYHHGTRILTKEYQEPWTQENKQTLLKLHDEWGNNWAQIGRLLGKVADDVKHMHARLVATREKSGKWDKDEDKALVKAILGSIGVAKLGDIPESKFSTIN